MDNDFQRAKRPAKSASRVGKALRDRQDTNKPTQLFRTPEEVAAEDDLLPLDEASTTTEDQAEQDTPVEEPQSHKSPRLQWHWPPHKKDLLIAGALVLVAVIALSSFMVLHHSNKTTATAEAPKTVVKTPIATQPTTVPSTLTGLPVAPSVNQSNVTGVMIENTPDARPQSGLSAAGVVFEAIAEGGVTRFLALYQDTAPTNVGPIRSARPYYVQWDLGFDAAYAHVGGSTDALQDITSWHVQDMNQFYNGNYYHRITTREAPHNVYTGIDTLNKLEAAKGYSSTYTGFVRKVATPSAQPTARTINLTLSGYYYDAAYSYDATTNSYNRSESGAPQMDANTNTQLSPKVVIAMVVPETQGALDSSGAYYSDYNVIGSGPVSVFQDGTVTTGTWTKASNTSQITFTDTNGKTIGLDPGQTWITAVVNASDIKYTP